MPDLSNDVSKGWWLTSPKPEIARQIIVADYYVTPCEEFRYLQIC